MVAMAPWTVQLNSFAWNKKLAKYVHTKDGQPEKAMQLFQQMQQNHPQMIEICAELKWLSGFMHDGMGYVSHTQFLLHDVVEEELTLNPKP